MGGPAVWVYKTNIRTVGVDGDWRNFFASGRRRTWGGEDTMGPHNLAAMRQMAVGDLVIAWQSDRRHAVGLLRFEGLRRRDGVQRMLFTPLEQFDPPVPILDMRSTVKGLDRVQAFKRGVRRTLYATSPEEGQLLLEVCGVRRASTATGRGPVTTTPAQGAAVGAGFGAAEQNMLVETAAVNAVRAHLRGWKITSRERDGIGFDLECTRGRKVRHVEVKGVRGTKPEFILTEGERRRAETDPDFELIVVTDALRAPKLHHFPGASILERSELTPISWRVKPQR